MNLITADGVPQSYARVHDTGAAPVRVALVQHRWRPDPDELERVLLDAIGAGDQQGREDEELQPVPAAAGFGGRGLHAAQHTPVAYPVSNGGSVDEAHAPPCENTQQGYTVTRTRYPLGVSLLRRHSMAANEYQVTGMTCGHCEMSVREEVGEIPGVQDIQVSAQTGKLNVTAEGEIDDAKVLAAVEEAGYSAVRV